MVDVEEEKMKLCLIEHTVEQTDGLNVKRKYSSIRGPNLEECLKYTKLLHSEK